MSLHASKPNGHAAFEKEPRAFVITRNNGPALCFTGWELARGCVDPLKQPGGEFGCTWGFIYATVGGLLVWRLTGYRGPVGAEIVDAGADYEGGRLDAGADIKTLADWSYQAAPVVAALGHGIEQHALYLTAGIQRHLWQEHVDDGIDGVDDVEDWPLGCTFAVADEYRRGPKPVDLPAPYTYPAQPDVPQPAGPLRDDASKAQG